MCNIVSHHSFENREFELKFTILLDHFLLNLFFRSQLLTKPCYAQPPDNLNLRLQEVVMTSPAKKDFQNYLVFKGVSSKVKMIQPVQLVNEALM